MTREKEIGCGTLRWDLFGFFKFFFAHAAGGPFTSRLIFSVSKGSGRRNPALNTRGREILPLPAPGVPRPVTFPGRNSSHCASRELCFLDGFKALPCQPDYRSRGNVGVSEASPKRQGGCSAPVRHWGCFYPRIFRRV